MYLELDQTVWGNGDYTDSDDYAFTGTVYSDSNFDTAFNLTGFTLRIKLYSQPDETLAVDQSVSILNGGSGRWKFKPSVNVLSSRGLYTVVLEASKTGTTLQSINRQELVIR